MGTEGTFADLERIRREKAARSESAPPESGARPERTRPPVRKAGAPVLAPPVLARPESDPQWTAYTNTFWDEVVPTLRPADAIVLGQLWRLTVGFDRARCTIGMPKLGRRCGLSRNPLREAVERLELRGLIRRVAVENETANKDRGTVWEVLLPRPLLARSKSARPDSARAESAPMISDQKDDQTVTLATLRSIAATYRGADPASRLREWFRHEGRAVDEQLIAAALA